MAIIVNKRLDPMRNTLIADRQKKRQGLEALPLFGSTLA
jgi:hypothetical protein